MPYKAGEGTHNAEVPGHDVVDAGGAFPVHDRALRGHDRLHQNALHNRQEGAGHQQRSQGIGNALLRAPAGRHAFW